MLFVLLSNEILQSRVGHFFVNEKYNAYVGHDMKHVRHKPFVEPFDTFIPKSSSNTIYGTAIRRLLVLESGSHHLVWIGGDGSYEFGRGCTD